MLTKTKNSAEGLFQLFAYEFGAVLDELLIFGAERGCEVAIDVEFAGNLILHENRNNNLTWSPANKRDSVNLC